MKKVPKEGCRDNVESWVELISVLHLANFITHHPELKPPKPA